MTHYVPVPPHSLEAALKHVADGGRLAVPTYTHVTVIDKRALDRWQRAGRALLREDGEGYRIGRGKSSDYLLPGQLKYVVE